MYTFSQLTRLNWRRDRPRVSSTSFARVLFTTGQNSREQIASAAEKKCKTPKVLPEVLRNDGEKKVLMYDVDYFSGL